MQPRWKRVWRRTGVALAALVVVGAGVVADAAGAGSSADQADGRVPGGGDRLRVDEMPPVEVVGHRPSGLREEDRVGPNEQPRWTAHRRFPTTRIYVLPPGQVDVEYWLRTKVPREGPAEFEHRQEVEIGLPYRLQLDLYLIETHEEGGEVFVDQSVELRYAFAKWGRILGNPTAYFEWIHRPDDDRPEKFEVKLLFGGELASRWHWGQNFVWEQEAGGARETVVEWTPAISYTILDEVLSVGAEGKLELASEEPSRTYQENLRLGPSIQWRPIHRLHVDLAPLFGFTADSRKADIYLVAGWEF